MYETYDLPLFKETITTDRPMKVLVGCEFSGIVRDEIPIIHFDYVPYVVPDMPI